MKTRLGEFAVDEVRDAFLRVLDSQDTTTGGGTAAAIAGAMAGGLIAMVAGLSIEKEGLAPKEYYLEIVAEADSLAEELLEGGYQDSLAFSSVRAAYRLSKSTQNEKIIRGEAIQAAWIQAARVPLNNAAACARLLKLADRLQGRSNQNAASDLVCAYHLARTGLLGCLANVKINLPSIKDSEIVMELEKISAELSALVDS